MGAEADDVPFIEDALGDGDIAEEAVELLPLRPFPHFVGLAPREASGDANSMKPPPEFSKPLDTFTSVNEETYMLPDKENVAKVHRPRRGLSCFKVCACLLLGSILLSGGLFAVYWWGPEEPHDWADKEFVQALGILNTAWRWASIQAQEVEGRLPVIGWKREAVEWQVVAGRALEVHANMSEEGLVLEKVSNGSTVLGQQVEISWIRLEGREGFMSMRTAEGEALLRERNTLYFHAPNGSCDWHDLWPIYDQAVCHKAALVLGRNLSVHEVHSNLSPTGCFMASNITLGNTTLYMNRATNPDNILDDRQPICASHAYFTTTTTTTTRTPSSTKTSTSSTSTLTTSTSTTSTSTTTTTTSTTIGYPSLLCFAVMRVHSGEEDLIKSQLEARAGIFACDKSVVLSTEKVLIGQNSIGEDVYPWMLTKFDQHKGDLSKDTTNSWLNTETFMEAFNIVSKAHVSLGPDKKHYDWVVKADPDAVFFPDRLRRHVKEHNGKSAFLLNCHRASPFMDGDALLYGALEVFSYQALQKYRIGQARCKSELDWHGWGEDMYMHNCMNLLGVESIRDFDLVGDERCSGAPCSDGVRAAFHAFKDVDSWFKCWHESPHV